MSKRIVWTEAEDMTLLACHVRFGNAWSEYLPYLPGRNENAIHHHWEYLMSKTKMEIWKWKSESSSSQEPSQEPSQPERYEDEQEDEDVWRCLDLYY
jgi:hypothetical protein